MFSAPHSATTARARSRQSYSPVAVAPHSSNCSRATVRAGCEGVDDQDGRRCEGRGIAELATEFDAVHADLRDLSGELKAGSRARQKTRLQVIPWIRARPSLRDVSGPGGRRLFGGKMGVDPASAATAGPARSRRPRPPARRPRGKPRRPKRRRRRRGWRSPTAPTKVGWDPRRSRTWTATAATRSSRRAGPRSWSGAPTARCAARRRADRQPDLVGAAGRELHG